MGKIYLERARSTIRFCFFKPQIFTDWTDVCYAIPVSGKSGKSEDNKKRVLLLAERCLQFFIYWWTRFYWFFCYAARHQGNQGHQWFKKTLMLAEHCLLYFLNLRFLLIELMFATLSQHQENQGHQWLKINVDARRELLLSVLMFRLHPSP